MSKIVRAANSMHSNSDKISNVINHNDHWFFLYDEKYAWCIETLIYEGQNRYTLYFLKDGESFFINDIVKIGRLSRQNVKSLVKQGEAIEYDSNEIGTNEALTAFRLLYMDVKEKGFGIDKVLDEIIHYEGN